MITKFQIYEKIETITFDEEGNITNEPQIGDWVLVRQYEYPSGEKDIHDYLTTHIGQVDSKKGELFNLSREFFIKYGKDYIEDYPNPLLIMDDEIRYFSKNKEELEMILQAKKYNL